MRRPAVLAVLALLLVPASSGCLELFGGRPNLHVARTPVDEAGWNRDGVFTVQVQEPDVHDVRITGTAQDGRTFTSTGVSSAELPPVEASIPDGTWTIRYYIDGTKWETFRSARFDRTPPAILGLATLGTADAGGTYLLGAGASLEAGATLKVLDQETGELKGTSFPVTLAGLADGLYAYDVVATDAAGNEATENVEVRVGSAQQLPAGQHTLGLVARYTVAAKVWDLRDLDTWPTPEQARAAAGGEWLGSGRAIEPNDPLVQQVVASEVTAAMTTGEAAMALFAWMADELEYDDERLDATTLLRPAQTIADGEDPVDDTPAGKGGPDGLARNGAGNGVKGGVCRDLAAVYASLLRAAGIPARLVTGYLGGEVNGFHAWVEFYGGPGHGDSPWIPVDVSGIDGPYDVSTALQAFGLRHTDMLPLRIVSSTQEDESWSTAVAVSTRYPGAHAPDVSLQKALTTEFAADGTLCIDRARLARLLVSSTANNACPREYPQYIAHFTRSATLVLDYGATVADASGGTEVTVTLSTPSDAAAAPGHVDQRSYCRPAANCGAVSTDATRGTQSRTWSI